MFTASFGRCFSDPTGKAAVWTTFQDSTVPEEVTRLLDAGQRERSRQLELVFGEESVSSWNADGTCLAWRLGVDDTGAWRSA